MKTLIKRNVGGEDRKENPCATTGTEENTGDAEVKAALDIIAENEIRIAALHFEIANELKKLAQKIDAAIKRREK